ncbi:MAG: hypothetical protein LBQ96_09265, partial [Fusobacteriaceae bacterium]|nr:hypothetical protein [Fusobacteriaceae bacterium]
RAFTLEIRAATSRKDQRVFRFKDYQLCCINCARFNRGSNSYDVFELEELRRILWALFNYLRTAPVYLKTVIVNKKYINEKSRLTFYLKERLLSFKGRYNAYLESFEQTVIFYDRGQKELADILMEVFPENGRIIWNSRFDKMKERLFQVADMMTFFDKLLYKLAAGLPVTKAEKLFFPAKDLKFMKKALANKRLQ